jgi:hypothetical protein
MDELEELLIGLDEDTKEVCIEYYFLAYGIPKQKSHAEIYINIAGKLIEWIISSKKNYFEPKIVLKNTSETISVFEGYTKESLEMPKPKDFDFFALKTYVEHSIETIMKVDKSKVYLGIAQTYLIYSHLLGRGFSFEHIREGLSEKLAPAFARIIRGAVF